MSQPVALKDKNSGDFKQDLREAKQDARDIAHHVHDDLQDAAHKAGATVRQLFDSASDELTHAKQAVSEQIHNKPVQSSLIALGAGVILGMLLRR